MLSAYAAAATAAAPLLRGLLRHRAGRGKEIAARLGERFGADPTPRPPGRLLWMHAASIGETVSVLPVLAALHELAPDVCVLMTTGTVTSAEVLTRRLPALLLDGCVLHRFAPLDVPRWASAFLDHWRPDAAALVESEIWPNLIAAASRRHIPLLLLNARLSSRSFGRWRCIPAVARTLFGAFTRVQAQSEGDARRLRALGARHVETPGNLKFAGAPLPLPEADLQRVRDSIAGRPVWLAASTHPGEEAMVIAVHTALAARHAGLLTILVPRHPQRGTEIAALAGDVALTRRALCQGPPPGDGIWLADTLGELGLFYAAVGVAFVGGSLVAHGGQNPLEPARLGCAVAVGPHVDNFLEPVAALAAAGAVTQVRDTAALADWLDALLSDPDRCRRMGEAGSTAARRDADLPREVGAMLAALLPA